MTYRNHEDLAKETGPTQRFIRGMIRRMKVTLTDSVLWQLLGQRGGPGGDETPTVEPFTGIGFYSRPSTSSTAKPEAITAAVGGHKNTVIVATRDEGTRKIGAGDLNANETCVYNDVARIIVKADGTVEIRLHGGVAVPLATKADVQAISTYLQKQFSAIGHTHTTPSGATTATVESASTATPGLCPNPTGTSVLKAQ